MAVTTSPAGNAQTGREADLRLRNILDLHGHPVGLREDDLVDVLHVLDETHAADVDGLLPKIDRAPTDVDVGIAQRRHHLRQGDAIGFQLLWVDLDVVLLGRASPADHLGHARYGLQAALQYPILQGSQVGQPKVGRSFQLIAHHLADQAGRLNLRLDVVGQADVLLEGKCRLRVSKVVVDPVLEGHAHERQTVERRGADILHTGCRGQADFHWHRVVPLHFFGR